MQDGAGPVGFVAQELWDSAQELWDLTGTSGDAEHHEFVARGGAARARRGQDDADAIEAGDGGTQGEGRGREQGGEEREAAEERGEGSGRGGGGVEQEGEGRGGAKEVGGIGLRGGGEIEGVGGEGQVDGAAGGDLSEVEAHDGGASRGVPEEEGVGATRALAGATQGLGAARPERVGEPDDDTADGEDTAGPGARLSAEGGLKLVDAVDGRRRGTEGGEARGESSEGEEAENEGEGTFHGLNGTRWRRSRQGAVSAGSGVVASTARRAGGDLARGGAGGEGGQSVPGSLAMKGPLDAGVGGRGVPAY